MKQVLHGLLALFVCAALSATGTARAAVGSDASALGDETVRVAGHALHLNGAGLGQRYVFKVYAIGLYLPEPRHTLADVLGCDGPARISIVMLRDVSSLDFARAIADSVAAHGTDPADTPTPGSASLATIGLAIAAQPQGLHEGDRLTFDWVPGVGTVVELNRRSLLQPVADRGLYDALLKVWLGARPTDTGLKSHLLGVAAR